MEQYSNELKIPKERVAILIGKKGEVKKELEDRTKTKIIIDSSYKLVDLQKYFNIQINEIIDEEIETVGGLAFFIAGKVPKNGEINQYKDLLKLHILSASDRRIHSLEIDKL